MAASADVEVHVRGTVSLEAGDILGKITGYLLTVGGTLVVRYYRGEWIVSAMTGYEGEDEQGVLAAGHAIACVANLPDAARSVAAELGVTL